METELDALSSDLAFYSAHAAAELDNIVREREFDRGYLTTLSRILDASYGVEPKTDHPGRQGLFDPITTDVLRQACGDAYHLSVESVEDLTAKTAELRAALRSLVSVDENKSYNLPPDDVATLRDFCLALSRHSLAVRSHAAGDWRETPLKR